MKRWSILAAALVFALGALSGCGKQGREALLDSNDPVAITVWHYYNGAQMQAFDAMVADFNETVGAEKGIVVDALSKGSIPDLEQQVIAAADKQGGADPLPDMFIAYPDIAYAMKNRELLAAVSDYLTEEEIALYVPAYIDAGKDSTGKRYMFPIAKSTEVFMMDMTTWNAFSSATGVSDEGLKTIEGVTEIAEKYYDWSGGKAFFGRDAFANYMLVGARQLGMEIFEVADDGSVTYNTDETVMRKLWDNHYVPFMKGHFAAEGRYRSDNIKTGLIISLVGSTSGSAYFPTAIEYPDGSLQDIDVGVYPAPVFAEGPPTAVQQGADMVITRSTEQKEYAATVFLKWFTQPEQNIRFCVNSGYMPVTVAANDEARIREIVDTSETQVSPVVLDTLLTSVRTVNSHAMYTSDPFEDGTDARDILDMSMENKAAGDMEALNTAIAGGADRETALVPYLSDENFMTWLESLRADLAAL